MKQAVIITPFDSYSYEVRVKYLVRYLEEKGYSVQILTSDFDHRTKSKYEITRSNTLLLPTKSYKKNISISRIYSHFDFSKKVYSKLEKVNPDVVYCSGLTKFFILLHQ